MESARIQQSQSMLSRNVRKQNVHAQTCCFLWTCFATYICISKKWKKYLHKKSLGKRSLTLLQRTHFIRFIPTSDHQKAPHLGKIAPVDVDPKSNDLKSIEIRCFQCKVKLKHLKEFEILWKPTQIASYNHLLTISVCFYMLLRLSNLFILHCYSVQSK